MTAIKPADLTILRYPAPELRERAKPIAKIDDHVRAVAARMIELMQDVEGLGLAAPQVGLPWRMFVTNVPEERMTKVYINPSLSNFGKETDVYEEGCLSLPGVHVDITRPTSATLTALDLEGKPITVTSDGFSARVWQHEFDHLNGVLIIDRLPAEERNAMRQSLKMKAALGG
jgi:peptide deformylase